jgi:type VI secretion system secreted protein VgrG
MISYHSGITHGGGERGGDLQKYFQSIKREAGLRQQLAESMNEVVAGTGTYAGLQAGATVDIANHTIESYNKSYFVLAVQHQGSNGAMFAGDKGEAHYQNSFELTPKTSPYRPPRITPWPVVSGSQVGIVVGPPGEEIFTDKFGRVQVCFRWDRKSAATSRACWIRVAQPFAGPQYGAVFIPRIGHEVLVEFLEGNPDNPIVVGSLYNDANMPPWALPANKTQSGVRTKSTLGGGASNFNELRFEDKKGSEQIYVQAEKDLDTLVKNNETRKVGNDRTTIIHNKDEKTVEEDDDITTVKKGKQIITVEDNDREISVKKDQNVKIEENENITITKNQTVDIGETQTTSTGANCVLKVTKDHNVQVDGEETIKVKEDQTVQISKGNHTTTVDMGNFTLKVKMGNIDVKVDLGKVTIEAMQNITLKVGQSSIEINQMGVTIKGMMVKVEGQVQAQVKAPMTQVNGDGMLMLKGGITMIN